MGVSVLTGQTEFSGCKD